jgi:hypothetical protein
MSSKHFHAPLNCNDVLRSMAVRRFAISMSLTIHFHSERSISVDECVWEKWRRSRARCITHNPQAIASEQAFTFS